MIVGLKFECWKFWNDNWETIKDFDENNYTIQSEIVNFTLENMKSTFINSDNRHKEEMLIIEYFKDFKKDNIKNVIDYAHSWNTNWHTGCRNWCAAIDLNRASKFNY